MEEDGGRTGDDEGEGGETGVADGAADNLLPSPTSIPPVEEDGGRTGDDEGEGGETGVADGAAHGGLHEVSGSQNEEEGEREEPTNVLTDERNHPTKS